MIKKAYQPYKLLFWFRYSVSMLKPFVLLYRYTSANTQQTNSYRCIIHETAKKIKAD